jgi:hypothetical protein
MYNIASSLVMKRAQYVCSVCYREFTRKNNGERHNEKLHASTARITPLKLFRYGEAATKPRNKKFGFLSSTDSQTKEELLFDVLESIGKEFEGCEREMDNFSSQDKAWSLTQILLHSLRYEDPKVPMKKFLRGLKRNKLNLKIIQYVAAGLEITPYHAEQTLIQLIE